MGGSKRKRIRSLRTGILWEFGGIKWKGRKGGQVGKFFVCFCCFLRLIIFYARAMAPAREGIHPTSWEHCLRFPEASYAVISWIYKIFKMALLLKTETPIYVRTLHNVTSAWGTIVADFKIGE